MKPEKQIEQIVLLKAPLDGWWLHIYDSKAIYSKAIKRYIRSKLPIGHSDLAGITPCGRPAYIELKAAGKRYNLSEDQYLFLTTAIKRGAFAVCVESYDQLLVFYNSWVTRHREKEFLLTLLP